MREVDYLIVGGGMTASAAAMALSEAAPNARVVLLSAETRVPYDRPPLSKDLWQEDDPDFDTIAHDDDLFGDAELMLGRRAVDLDREDRVVLDDHGTAWHYGRLLLATGARPLMPPFAEGLAAATTFRTWDDLERVKDRLAHGRRVTVIGGGFLGSELAAALVQSGASVTLAFPESDVLGRILPASLAARVTTRFRRAGVEVLSGSLIESLALLDPEREDGPVDVRSDGGESWTADGVIVCVGVRPNDELADEAGLEVDDGIVVDERFRTSDEHVFAAGDVARFPAPVLGPMRVEHEEHAKLGGMHAARSMTGADEAYDHLPMFYSDLFELGYEAVGRCDATLETLVTGPAGDDDASADTPGVVWYLDDGVPVGALAWNLFGQLDEARTVLRENRTFRHDELRTRIDAQES